MKRHILVLNVGSSSIKFALYPVEDTARPVRSGQVAGIGSAPVLSMKIGEAPDIGRLSPSDDSVALVRRLLVALEDKEAGHEIVAAGHRVVHGGQTFVEPVLIDEDVLQGLEKLIPLAPRHQPDNLAGVRAIAQARPDLPQVACFDTAFHRTQPRLARLFAIPRALTDEGILRYGFHGLSYEYIASVLPEHAGKRANGRVIVAHLGHGASLCAMHEGRSVATSMGFTVLDGLMMGRRPGVLDPGVVLHLMQDRGMGVDEVADLLHHECGLMGVSGISDDMSALLASDDPHACEAVDLFVYRAISQIGALVAILGGLDALVFTAGIGEHAVPVRARIAGGLGFLGLRLDDAANDAGKTCISTKDSKVGIYVVPTDEERVIAAHTCELWERLAR